MVRVHFGSKSENNLLLNVKTRELKEGKDTHPIYISGADVEQVNSFRFLGITEDQ